ncbi:MAG: ABC transporter substrate-binding protein [Christensenellales bacterium]|jgi:peptide/nickel transport system substrate-binding protein
MKKSIVSILLITLLLSFSYGALSADDVAKEAPALAELVAQGKLPPLEERIPEVPLVVVPLESIGTYGGVWHNMIIGGDTTHLERYQDYEQLVRWTPDWSGYIPNVAERFEISEDSTEFTFYLRKGMKWSDGTPFTSLDFDYQYNYFLLNKELTNVFPITYKDAKGNPAKLEIIDEATVKFVFSEPNGLFMLNLASVNSYSQPFAPAHYLKQFHLEFSENANELAKAAGYGDWIEYYLNRDDWKLNAERPSIDPWVFANAPDGTATIARAVRNPYFWKVDPDGKQLPYIDEIEYQLVSNTEVAVLKAAAGEIDFFDQNIATPANRSLFYDNMEVGNYHFVTTTMSAPNAMIIILNTTHRDPERRVVFGDKNFRIGLSHAINRQEIIDMIYLGDGIPHQTAPRPESDLYNEKLALQYTEYDVAKANEYLDKVLPNKGPDGMRLLPSGEKLIIRADIDMARDAYIDASELLTQYWAAVGVELKVDVVSRDLWEERTRNGDGTFDMTIHRFGGGAGTLIYTDPRYYFPFDNNSMYAMAWRNYYVDPTGFGAKIPPEEPPADVLRQMELYNQIKVTGDAEEQREYMKEILEIAVDRFYTIGVCTEGDSYAICNNDLVNVPDEMPWNWVYPHPMPTNPFTWYYRTGK